MVSPSALPERAGEIIHAWRLVNSRFPPIALFEDVADAATFEALYQIQALTNPRLRNEAGRLELIPRAEIPWGIPGCSYAIAPFTHLNPQGSRFSDGRFGVLYLAARMETALAEVSYHQDRYWAGVEGLNYERFVFRGLACEFSEKGVLDATRLGLEHPVHHPVDYTAARQLGQAAKQEGRPGLRYCSVRDPGQDCWGLLTPRRVMSIVQAAHYEMVWNGRITSVNRITEMQGPLHPTE